MSDAVEKLDQPITQQQVAQAIMSYFLTNAEAGNHAANDELIAELARRRTPGSPTHRGGTLRVRAALQSEDPSPTAPAQASLA